MEDSNHHTRPPKPRKPDPGECCGSGCTPCILELHEDAMDAWREAVRAIREREAQAARHKD